MERITVTAYDNANPTVDIGTNTGTKTNPIGVTVDANNSWDERTIIYKFSAPGLAATSVATTTPSATLTNPQPPAYNIAVSEAKDFYKPDADYSFKVTGTFPSETELSFIDKYDEQIGSVITPIVSGNTYNKNIPDISGYVTIRVKTGTSTYRELKQIDYPNIYGDGEWYGMWRLEIPSLDEIYNYHSNHEYAITNALLPPNWEFAADPTEQPKVMAYWGNNLDIYGDALVRLADNRLLLDTSIDGNEILIFDTTTIRAPEFGSLPTALPFVAWEMNWLNTSFTIHNHSQEEDRVNLKIISTRTNPITVYVLVKWTGSY
jgi:hypothetical protein